MQSLRKDYKIFASIVVAGSFVVSLTIIGITYFDFKKNSESKIINTNNQINQQINESLSYVENIANFIGNQIISNNNFKTKKGIAEVLLSTKPKIDQKTQDIFSWTLFDFTNKKSQIIASSLQGILSEPVTIKEKQRSWLEESRVEPWKLLPSKFDVGILSKEPIIPFGFGITAKSGEFIGILSVGINTSKLEKKLISVTSESYINFIVFDKEGLVVSKSNNLSKSDIQNISNHFNKIKPQQGFFKIENNNFYYQQNNDYQFKVVVGTDHEIFFSQFCKDSLPKILNTIYLTIFFLVLLFFFRAKIVRPVTRLSEAAEEISNGNLHAKVPHSDIFEVDLLANSIEKVKEFLVKEEEVKNTLVSSKEDAENANHNKTEFLASTAHELKNMLAGIMGLGELAKMNIMETSFSEKDDIKRKEVIAWISDLIKLGEESALFVNDILDINQAQTGDFKIEEIKSVDLQEIAERSVKLMRIKALKEKKNIITSFEKSSSKNFIASNLDPRRVKQIIVNIISNSVKYSPENSSIFLRISRLNFDETVATNQKIEKNLKESDTIKDSRKRYLLSLLQTKQARQESRFCIEIQDNGYGMSAKEIEIASKKYGTIDHDFSKRIDSTGLGIPIVKYLVEAQCGLLEIESEKNKGTTVRIVF